MPFNTPERDFIREGVRCVQKGSPCRFALHSVTVWCPEQLCVQVLPSFCFVAPLAEDVLFCAAWRGSWKRADRRAVA